jgi:uncharacterized protein YgiM (DUF1202 family)
MTQRTRRQPERVTSPLVVLLLLALVAVVGWQAWGAAGNGGFPRTGRGDSRPFVTTDDVNMRSGPGTTFDVLAVVPQASAVDVVGDPRNGFLPVRVEGRDAWIAADYLRSGTSVRVSTVLAAEAAVEREVAVERPPVADGDEGATTVAPAAPDTAEENDMRPAAAGIDEPVTETVAAELPAESADAAETGDETTDVAAPVPAGERWIEVDRSTATVTLHEGDGVVAVFTGLIGKDPSPDGYYSTATGTFHVYSMNRDLTETPFAPGVYLTDWVGFDPQRSNGFHSPVRDADGEVVHTGGTSTLGCVRLGEDEARQVFDFAFIGMRVEIHD